MDAARDLIIMSMFKAALYGVLFCTLLSGKMDAQSSSPQEESGFWARDVVKHVSMQYLIVLPRNYNKQLSAWPVLLYLHGAGDRGTDLALVRRTEAVQQAESRADFPFILVAPQVSDLDQSWLYPENRDAAINILDEVLSRYRADRSRVYLTGISMGGWGSWFFAYSFPNRFAAIAPLCGLDADLRWAPQIAKTPVWAFHGTNDTVAPIIGTEQMITKLKILGANPKFTPIIGGNHDIAKAVYQRDDLYQWFLQHSRDPSK